MSKGNITESTKCLTKIFEEFPAIKERYWGYFCVTAGELTKKMIEEYLADHFERNPNDEFDIEQPAAKPAGQ